MNLYGTRIGSIEFPDSDLISLPSGLVGMPGLTRFVILDFEEDLPFKWLQSVDEPSIGFLIAEPQLFRPDYGLALGEDDLRDLAATGLADLAVFVLCIYDAQRQAIAGNLRGPVLVNVQRRLGQQLVVEDMDYGTHETLNHFDWRPKTRKEKEQVAELSR